MRLFYLFAIIVALTSFPARAETATTIFLHNAWYETNKSDESNPRFGVYEFTAIKKALGTKGSLIAPEREAGADPQGAAHDLIDRINALMMSGIPARKIKVIGASKGAYIAQLASAALNQPDISWVLIGGCHIKRMEQGAIPSMTGRVLSIYEQSDTIAGSCASYEKLSKNTTLFKEKALENGKDHGFQFTPSDDWIRPALDW